MFRLASGKSRERATDLDPNDAMRPKNGLQIQKNPPLCIEESALNRVSK